MKVVLGVIYTPFIPGGVELEKGVAEARSMVPPCVQVIDASGDALTIMDLVGDADLIVIVGASGRVRKGTYKRVELVPSKAYEQNPHALVEDIRASMEGSLDPLDLGNALSALLSVYNGRTRIVVYACGVGACKEALREATREAAKSAEC